jgi:hypothetical protein
MEQLNLLDWVPPTPEPDVIIPVQEPIQPISEPVNPYLVDWLETKVSFYLSLMSKLQQGKKLSVEVKRREISRVNGMRNAAIAQLAELKRAHEDTR